MILVSMVYACVGDTFPFTKRTGKGLMQTTHVSMFITTCTCICIMYVFIVSC